MRTRYLLNTGLLAALLIAGFALPSQAEAWNGGYHSGYSYPRPHFSLSFQFGSPIYPSMGYNYGPTPYGYYRPHCYYPPYPQRHFYPRGYRHSYPSGGFYRYRY